MLRRSCIRCSLAVILAPVALYLISRVRADVPRSAAPTGVLTPQSTAAPHSVTLALTGEPVVDLLRDLSHGRVPRLSAAPVLGERRVNVFARDLPELKFQRALADVVSGVWTRREKGEALYLEPDPAATRERDELLAARKARFFAGLKSLIRQLSLDEAGVKRLQETDPISVSYLTRTASRTAIQLTSLLNEQQWHELETTGRVSLTPDQLGPQGGALIREYTRQMNEAREEARKEIHDDPLPPDPSLDPEQTSRHPLQFWVDGPTFGPVKAPFSNLHVMIGEWPPPQFGAGAASMVITGSQESNQPPARWLPHSKETPKPAPAEASASLSFKQAPSGWSEVLRAFHDGLHLQIVSEEFTRQFPGHLQLEPGMRLSGTLPQLLDRVCQSYGYQWRLKDGIYQFRSSTWFVDREQEPPGTLVKAVRVAREQGKPLSLEWLAQAAGAAGSRPTNLLWVHAPAVMPVMMQLQPLLQFYGALTPQQRAVLESERGLAGDALSDGQRELLLLSWQRLSRGEVAMPSAQLHVQLVRGTASATFAIRWGDFTRDAVISLPFAGASGGVGGFGQGAPR
jgi:hypothetical protein